MDPVINSQISSPLIRSLNSVPGKSSHFTHGISDNIPPFSFDKFSTTPYQTSSTLLKFRWPQNGYMGRVYAKLIVEKGTAASNEAVFLSDGWNPSRFIKKVTLQSHNNVFNTLYGDTICADVARLQEPDRSAWGRLMRGYNWDNTNNLPTIRAWTPHVTSQLTNSKFGVMYIPLDFSSTCSLMNNYQTRFVEDLEVWVELYLPADIQVTCPGYVAPADASTRMELVYTYHNFHDNVENAIRNKNYKKGVPASILQHDYIKEGDVTTVYDGATTTSTITIKLRSNYLMSHFYLLTSTGSGVATKVPALPTNPVFDLEVQGSGRVLWKTNMLEAVADLCPYTLNTLNHRDLRTLGTYNNFDTKIAGAYTAVSDELWDQGGGDANLFENLATVLPFAFDSNTSVHTGGIALQSVADPKIIVKVFGVDLTSNAYVAAYVQYRTLIRIDSDSGVMTKAMNN